MPKSDKIAKILANKKLGDDVSIAIGEESFTLGELREMDADTGGASTSELEARQADLEQRENTLVAAQNNTMELLNGVADKLGVSLDDLIGGKVDGKIKRTATRTNSDDDPSLEGLDDSTKAAVVAMRKVLSPEINAVKEQLKQTREALGIGLKVTLDQYYEDTFDRLSGSVPKDKDGKPLVNLSLKSVLEHADKNKLMDGRGRLNVKKAIDELTSEARTQQMILEAEDRGAKRREQELQASAATRPGAGQFKDRPAPLTDSKGKTLTIADALDKAREDTDIWKNALSGGFGSA